MAASSTLSFTVDNAIRELHRDKTLAEWRGCPVGYRLYAVLVPFERGGIADTVAIISSCPFGFEGPDRRFLAVPMGQRRD